MAKGISPTPVFRSFSATLALLGARNTRLWRGPKLSTPHPSRGNIYKMSTSSKPASGKRAYLRRAERQQNLLETAAHIVETQGWTALSMSALAEQAGTSRQLVYQHFSSLEVLLAKTAEHIFEEVRAATHDSVAAHPNNLTQAIAAAEAISLDLPQGRGDALWQLINGTAANSAELDAIRRGLRDVILELWLPTIQREFDMDETRARVVGWSLIMGFWGMRQLIRDGVVERDEAMAAFNQLIARMST